MIIYGAKSRKLSAETTQTNCPACGANSSIELYVFQKYAHVFWIPLFPVSKIGAAQCENCKKVFTTKEMTGNLKLAYNDLKQRSKTPVWTFIGAAIIGLIIISGIVEGIEKSKNSAKYIQSLQRNDLLETKTSDGNYTYLKVVEVKGDSIFLRENKQAVNIETAFDKLGTSDKSFQDEIYIVMKAALLKSYQEGKILNVIRINK